MPSDPEVKSGVLCTAHEGAAHSILGSLFAYLTCSDLQWNQQRDYLEGRETSEATFTKHATE